MRGHQRQFTWMRHAWIAANSANWPSRRGFPTARGPRLEDRSSPSTGLDACPGAVHAFTAEAAGLVFLKLFERIYAPLTAGLLQPLGDFGHARPALSTRLRYAPHNGRTGRRAGEAYWRLDGNTLESRPPRRLSGLPPYTGLVRRTPRLASASLPPPNPNPARHHPFTLPAGHDPRGPPHQVHAHLD
jgi:hypothetical protein